MKTMSALAIAAAFILGSHGVARAEEPAAATARQSDCNRVMEAKAKAGKTVSSQVIAGQLDLSVDVVNECLLQLRQAPSAASPDAPAQD